MKLSEEKINNYFQNALKKMKKEFKKQLVDLETILIENIKKGKLEKAYSILSELEDSRKINILVKRFAAKNNNEVYLSFLKMYLIKKYNIENEIYIEKVNFDFIDYILDEFGINIIMLKKGNISTNKYDYLLKTKNTKNYYLNYLISENFMEEFIKYKNLNLLFKVFNKKNHSQNFNRFVEENKDLNIDNAILKELKLFTYEELLVNKELLINSKIKTELILNLIEEKKQEIIEKKHREDIINKKMKESVIFKL